MPAIVVAALALAALAYAVRPLMLRAEDQAPPTETDAEVRKLRALEAIVELEADLAAGKISSEDFESFKDGYARDALIALREQDVAAQDREDRALESEIAAARARLR